MKRLLLLKRLKHHRHELSQIGLNWDCGLRLAFAHHLDVFGCEGLFVSVQITLCNEQCIQWCIPVNLLTSPAFVRATIHKHPRYEGTKTITVPPGSNVFA
jgi:hypothetical protein